MYNIAVNPDSFVRGAKVFFSAVKMDFLNARGEVEKV